MQTRQKKFHLFLIFFKKTKMQNNRPRNFPTFDYLPASNLQLSKGLLQKTEYKKTYARLIRKHITITFF